MTLPPPPQPLPNNLWGDTWKFVTLSADDLEHGLLQRPIPIQNAAVKPSRLGLMLKTPIPGIVIEAGRRSLKLAQWIEQQQPQAIASVLADLNGVLLQTANGQRWILMTYQDAEMAAAAKTFEAQKLKADGLHFLLIQPDESGITYSGLWVFHTSQT